MFVATGKGYFSIFPFSGLLITVPERRRRQFALRNTTGCILLFVKGTEKITSISFLYNPIIQSK